jgi:hypothetical protein
VTELTRSDEFQIWLMEMDTALERFIVSAPSAVAERLDLSAESLDAIEAWLLSKYDAPEEVRPASESTFHDGAARYIGEVFRTHTGSKWSMDSSDPKNLNYGVPALTGGKLTIGLCPLTLVTALLDRRNGRYLSTILRNVTG